MDSRGIHALNGPMARITRPFLPTDHPTWPAERLERTLFLLELLVWLLLMDVGVLLYEFVVDPQPMIFAAIGAVGLSYVVSALLVRAGVSVRHVALGIASFFYLTCTVGATLDGPSLELPLWLTIIPPIAAYLIHPRAGLLFCLAAIVCGAASIEVYALLTGSTHQIVDFQSLGPRMAPAFVALGCTLMFIEQLHLRTRRRLAWVISVRDEAERGLRESRDALRDESHERERLQSELLHAQKLESIGSLAAGIAHEINTPAQYVGDNVQFLEESLPAIEDLLKRHCQLLEAAQGGSLDEAQVKEMRGAAEEADLPFLCEELPSAVEQARSGIGRITEIVRAMKEFSHPGSSEKQPADLNHCIESTVTVARNEWKYHAEMELQLDPELPSVGCLPGELNQVFLNIIVNAAQAIAEQRGENGEKGQIRIRTRTLEDGVEIEICDDGPGIPEAIRSKVFDPFFTTKEVGLGSGQGLAIARSVVVDKHGGTIQVESEEDTGTIFRITLPLADSSTSGEQASP